MNIPSIIWTSVVALIILFVIARFIRACLFCSKGHHRFIEFGSEREELFIPGDSLRLQNPENDDYEDFDDI